MSINNILALVVVVSLLITLISLFIFYHIIKKSIDNQARRTEGIGVVTHSKVHLVPITLTDQAYQVYRELTKSLSRTIPTEVFIAEFLEAEAISFTLKNNKEDN